MRSIIFLPLFFFACGSTNNFDKNDGAQLSDRGSRLEQVAVLPYRTIEPSNEQKDRLLEVALEIWYKCTFIDNDDIYLFEAISPNQIHLADSTIKIIDLARTSSYELWKEADLEYTCLVYFDTSVDSLTGEIDRFYVIEIEHKAVTGTFRVFIPEDKKIGEDDFRYSYVDRN